MARVGDPMAGVRFRPVTVARAVPRLRGADALIGPCRRGRATARSGSVFLTAAISLDTIPLGVDCEGSVVVGAIVHTQAGWTVVGASGAERRDMESIDGYAAWRSEAEMEV